MMKINKHIEIVRSSVEALSSLSLKSSDAIFDLLKQHYVTVGVTTVNTLADLDLLVAKQPDLVFMGMKYVPGPTGKVWLSGYFDQHNISHTGSPELAITLEQNKPLAKQRVLDSGHKTAAYLVIKAGQTFTGTDLTLRFPLFVKPTSLGGGEGVDTMSVVHNLAQLLAKVSSLAANHSSDILVEEYLPGREFSVAVLKDAITGRLQAMPIEMLPGQDVNGDRMLSQALKSGKLETPVQAVTEPVLRAELIDLAINVFTALGARDYGRIDIRLDADGVPSFLEANLIPCLIRGSGNFPKACMINADINYRQMILQIVNLGLERQLEEFEDNLAKLHPLKTGFALPV